jgi:hypothetical protein
MQYILGSNKLQYSAALAVAFVMGTQRYFSSAASSKHSVMSAIILFLAMICYSMLHLFLHHNYVDAKEYNKQSTTYNRKLKLLICTKKKFC